MGSSLSFDNCQIQRNGELNVTSLILDNDSTIDNLAFNGYGLRDAGSQLPLADLFGIESGTIGQLVINSVDSTNINAPTSPGGFSSVGSVSGAGVLETGWEYPDAVMADGVPYISAGSGLPSIKVAGVVEPYTQP